MLSLTSCSYTCWSSSLKVVLAHFPDIPYSAPMSMSGRPLWSFRRKRLVILSGVRIWGCLKHFYKYVLFWKGKLQTWLLHLVLELLEVEACIYHAIHTVAGGWNPGECVSELGSSCEETGIGSNIFEKKLLQEMEILRSELVAHFHWRSTFKKQYN